MSGDELSISLVLYSDIQELLEPAACFVCFIWDSTHGNGQPITGKDISTHKEPIEIDTLWKVCEDSLLSCYRSSISILRYSI